MSTEHLSGQDFDSIEQAAQLLQHGALVVIPTETVYGLAANAYNEEAVKAIFELKGRPSNNPLIVHISSQDELASIVEEIPHVAEKLAQHFWPGSLTLVLKKRAHISAVVSANYDTVAVRVPNHPMTLKLLKSLDFPLVAPSANRSNHISPTKPEHVRKSFGQNTPYILDGGSCQRGLESTIVGFQGEDVVLHRQGAIAQEEIESFLGKPVLDFSNTQEQSHNPGSSNKHYSPSTPMILVDKIDSDFEDKYNRIGYLVLEQTLFQTENIVFHLSKNGDLEEAATNLYDALHQMDQMNLDIIISEKMPNFGLGKSINDRLTRAASK